MSEKKEVPTKLLTPKTIAEELGGATQDGEGYLAFCPSHSDTNTPSLLISNSTNASNGLMVHCRAGCKPAAVIKELGDRNLWPAKKRRKRREKQAEYDYYNADGSYAFTKARYLKSDGSKTFEVGRRDDKTTNGWVKGMAKGQKKILYRLPELISADTDRVVFVVEGEKDVDSLIDLGCQAVCNHDGSGGWDDSFGEWLRDIDVVVLPDNDRAGRDHAVDVVKSLNGVAKRVRVLELPGLPEKGDVSDWIEAGGERKELSRLVIEESGELEERWEDQLLMTGGDYPKVKNLEFNYVLYLRHHPDFEGQIRYNEFTNDITYRGAESTESTETEVICALQVMGLQATREKVIAALKLVASENKYDPLADYVNGLEWDGVPRLATMFRDFFGATIQSDEYLANVASRWMTSGIARALKPGVKADQWLILEGGQGIGKSTGAEMLSPFEGWFQDQLPDISKNTKDAKMALFGRWIIEIAELEAIRKADQEAVKKFASLRVDKERLPYERRYSSFPRRCVFIGTHNPGPEKGYFTDPTGARRFLPVEVGKIDVGGLRETRDQLWAEAKALYEAGERWWTEPNDPGVVDEQRARFVQSDYADEAFQYLEFEPFEENDGSGAVTWKEREVPLDVFIPKYFWLDRFSDQWVKAPWAAKKDIKSAFQNSGWEKVHARFPELAEDHGDDRRIKLTGWTRPSLSGGDKRGSTSGSTTPKTTPIKGLQGSLGDGHKSVPIKNQVQEPKIRVVDPQVDPQVDPVETGYKNNALQEGGSSGSTTSIVNEVFLGNSVDEGEECSLEKEPYFLSGQVDPLGQSPSLSTLEDLKELLEGSDGPIGFDVETTGLKVVQGARCRLAQFWRGGEGVVIDLFQLENGLADLKEVLDGSHLVAFNAQFELQWLRDAGIKVGRLDDAKLAFAALFGGTTSLDKACKKFLGVELDKTYQKSNWAGPLSEEQIKYAIDDAEYALKLWQLFVPVMQEKKVVKGYELLRKAMLPVAMMQESGMRFDVDGHQTIMERVSRGKELADRWLAKRVPEIENWNSTKQIREWLGPKLTRRQRYKWEKTKTGALSVGAKAVTAAFGDGVVPGEVARILAVYCVRQDRTTILKSFGSSLAAKVMDDRRIYGDLQISGAITGRMSSSKPNLQNMPNGKGFRELFIAEEGNTIVVCDYSQIEVRVGGLLAGEPVLDRIFKEGKDVHTASAALMYHVDYDKVEKWQRKNAKGLTFGMQYGMGTKSLAKMLGMTEAEATQQIVKWEATYPEVAKWRTDSAESGTSSLELFTASGRRIALNPRPSPSVCYNYPVQGSAGDVMYAALRVLAEALESDHRDWKMLNVVHDEVVMEVPSEDAPEAAKLLEQCMIDGYLQIFPQADTTGVVDASWGSSWAAK